MNDEGPDDRLDDGLDGGPEAAGREGAELGPRERAALDAWTALPPPAEFAARVLAARAAAAPVGAGPSTPGTVDAAGAATRRRPWPRGLGVVVTLGATAAAAATALVVLRPAGRAAHGELTAATRTTRTLGDRAVAVAEPAATLTWRIDDDGAAELEQRTGSVFYRVDRGGPFVVHTPAGDVRVTGTCFRIEVPPMNKQALIAGVVGAALSAGVVVTVYEGRVLATTPTARTEVAAGASATLGPDGRTIVGPAGGSAAPALDAVATAALATADEKAATREELLARTIAQRAELARVTRRLAELERGPGGGGLEASEPGRRWFDPSPETLASWAADCKVRSDEPGFDGWQPQSGLGKNDLGLEASELSGYNTALAEVQATWKALVRALYIETTNDVAGADTLSLSAMRGEIQQKGAPGEHNLVLQRIAAERAGLAQPPTDLSHASPYERMMRAYFELGDQAEEALARKIGPARAKEIRGDGWGSRSEWAGCPG